MKQLIVAVVLASLLSVRLQAVVAAPPDTEMIKRLRTELKTQPDLRDTDLVETMSDYIFALFEAHATPKFVLMELLDFKGPATNEPGAVQHAFRSWNCPYLTHWLAALEEFHVVDFESLGLLNKVLTAASIMTPTALTRAQTEIFERLMKEVEPLQASTDEEKLLKAQTIWRIALAVQSDKGFGRRAGMTALEQFEAVPFSDKDEQRDAMMRVLYSYQCDHTNGTEQGDLLLREVKAIARMAIILQDKNSIPSPESIYPQLYRRCLPKESEVAQGILVHTAETVGVEKSVLATLACQLGCAHMIAGHYELAETAFRKSVALMPDSSLTAKLCLAECLRREEKISEAIALCDELVKVQALSDRNSPSEHVAVAKVVRAKIFIREHNFAAALPLLQSSNDRFCMRPDVDLLFSQYSYLNNVLPHEQDALADTQLVFEQLKRHSEAEQIAALLDRVRSDHVKQMAKTEKDSLINVAQQPKIGAETSISNANRFISACTLCEDTQNNRVELLLAYAESLIANGSMEAAEMCLSACDSKPFVPSGKEPSVCRRIGFDRLWIEEERGNFALAQKLEKSLPETPGSGVKEPDSLRESAIRTRLLLLMGDYKKAEEQSRALDEALVKRSKGQIVEGLSRSARDVFSRDYEAALLDRAQALAHLGRFTESISIAQDLIDGWHQNGSISLDALAIMAAGYGKTGHSGMMKTAVQQTTKRLQSFTAVEPSRQLADMYLRLGQIAKADGNQLRASRYFSNAAKCAEQCHLQDSDLYREIRVGNQ